MKKTFSVLLVVFLVLGLFVGCTTSGDTDAPKDQAPSSNNGTPDQAPSSEEKLFDGIYDGIEPLETPIELNIGYLTGSHHGMISYMIERMGGFEKVGITPKFQVFGNGPVMVEALASDSWDCGTYGLGGTLTGVISQGAYVIGAAARDFDSLCFFAKNDSDIVAAGKTLSDYPNVYGTADTWKGKEIFVPTGTTLHYTLATGLEKFGLEDSDVKLTHMDVTSVNTALRANQGEIGGLWGSFAYASDMSDKFTMVMSAGNLGINLPTVHAANPRSYDNPEKYLAIKKWMELYFATVDWIYANDENFAEAAEMFTEINQDNGVKCILEENVVVLDKNRHYSLEDNYEYYNTMSDDGKMMTIEQMNYDPLMFFIGQGNYKPEDEATFLNGYFKGDIVNELYKEKYGE